MFLQDKIFGRVNILKVSFMDSSRYECALLQCKYNKGKLEVQNDPEIGEAEKLLKDDKAVPLMVIYSGHGIIGKNRESLPAKLLEKLIPGETEFLWTEDSAGFVVLLRRGQAAGIETTVEESGARLIGATVCGGNDNVSLLECGENLLSNTIKFKRLFKTDRTGSELARLVFDKLKLPVLAIILLLLTVNYFHGDKSRAELSKLQMEFQAQQKASGAAGETDKQKNALFEKYNRHMPHGFSWISDRIAIVLPETMLLTSLKLQPLSKKIEDGKELEIVERQVEILGNAGNTEDIMRYISALKKLGFAREVKMVSFEQERNTSDLFFKLMLFL